MSLFEKDKPEFDPERELTPERKQWRPEWLRSDRERHETESGKEKSKKERARELKTAAKKRGEELEKRREQESRLKSTNSEQAIAPAEDEIAPKGEKLRKKWRRALLEKSQRLMEFFRREAPETIDGVQLAEIMVAERIITLNTFLDTTQPKTDERRETKTELDFMGLLSEKLSSPEIEVPAEIEEVHRKIIETSQEIAEEGVELDVGQIEEMAAAEPRTASPGVDSAPEPIKDAASVQEDRHDAFVRHGVAVMAALRTALKAVPVPTSVGLAGGSSVIGGAVATGVGSHSQRVVVSALPVSAPTIRAATAATSVSGSRVSSPVWEVAPVIATAAVVHELRSEAKNLAVAVSVQRPEGASNRPPHPEVPPSPVFRETRPSQPAPVFEQRVAPSIPIPVEAAVTHEASERMVVAPHHQPEQQQIPRPDSSVDGRRFEHMETKELLELARDVAIGHGQYLKRAYETGQIDRDGLIRVLKARRRGQDYVSQFRLTSRQYRERVSSMRTQERLAEPHDNKFDDAVRTSPNDTQLDTSSSLDSSPSDRQQAADAPTRDVSSAQPEIDPMREASKREHPVPLGAILLGVGTALAGGAVYFFFFR